MDGKMMKEIMSKAWEIAKNGAAQFGGKVREYFGIALKMAWAAAKAPKSLLDRIEELETLGFKRWQKNGMDRMYINADKLGLELGYYKTGNVSWAHFCGEHISNAEGRRLDAAKTYIDLVKHTINSTSCVLAAKAAELCGVSYRYGDTVIAW